MRSDPDAPPLSLTRALAGEFDREARRKGESYAREGRVKVTYASPEQIHALVQGTRRYEVEIRPRGSVTDCYCTCPRFEDGYACKHLWAVAVKVDELNEVLPAHPGPAPQPRTPWKEFFGVQRPREARTEWPEDGRLTYHLNTEFTKATGEFAVRIRAFRPDGNGGVQDLTRLMFRLDPSDLPDADDRALFSLNASDPLREIEIDQFVVQPFQLGVFLPILGRTGRFYLKGAAAPSTWDDGAPWKAAVTVDRGLRLWGHFERDGERMDLREPDLILGAGFLFARSKISRLTYDASFDLVSKLRHRGPIQVPPEEAPEFLAELHGHPAAIGVSDEHRFAEVRVAPQPSVTVTAKRRDFERRPSARLAATVLFDYLGLLVRAGDTRPKVVDATTRRVIHRDLDAERKRMNELYQAGFLDQPKWREYADFDFEIDGRRLPRAVPQLIATGWRVEADGIRYVPPGKFKLEVSSGVDWFDLKGGLEFEGQVAPFPALLAAARRGEKHVVLGDGSFGILPEEWLKRRGLVLGAGETEGDAIRFRPGQAMLLDALLAAEERVAADPGFDGARRELRSFETLEPEEPPAGFLGELRPYQKLALGWFEFLRRVGWGGCLADDMGLGKTVQALALLSGAKGPHLVVVPRSLVFNWRSEAARFAPHLKVGDEPGDADIVLTTYGLLRRNAPRLKDVEFEYVILDEAQAIKNASSATAKAVRLLKGKHRLAMSGTPIENHLGELWSLMEFLNPGLLGAASVFKGASGADEESRKLLAKALRPFILRRTKEQVAPELPPRVEQTIEVDLDPAERRRYDELKEHYRRKLLGKDSDFRQTKFVALEALLRLRQAACHGGLIDPALKQETGTKLEILIERLTEVAAEGHKALVFSQFTSLLSILKPHLDAAGLKYEYLDGQTKDREACVKRFQEDASCPLFLISLKAGGLGLNLTAAEYVFLLDPWWNPASEAQAIDRAHRIGQEKPVHAMRLVARNTVEERVIELQQKKRQLADAILSADGGLMRGLTREDLSLLLS